MAATNGRIRVLLLLHELSLTGAPRVVLDQFEQLRDAIDVRIVSMRGGPLQERCRRLGRTLILQTLVRYGSLSSRIFRRCQLLADQVVLWQFMGLWRPDVIYVNTVEAIRIVQRLRLPRAPGLLHSHELSHTIGECLPEPKQQQLLRHWPARYIAASHAGQDALVHDCGIPADKVTLIYEGVSCWELEAAWAPPLPLAGGGRSLVVGGAGTPSWRKGTVLWLQMAVELRRLLGDHAVRFVWLGVDDSVESRRFRYMAGKLGLERSVEFVPPTTEPFRVCAGFDIFSMTSWEDTCPLVVFENMMLGKPVVCFAGAGGAPEQVGDTGLVIEQFSPWAMAEAIADMARSPERMAELGHRARERVRTQFSSSVQAPKILDEISALVTRDTAPRVRAAASSIISVEVR